MLLFNIKNLGVSHVQDEKLGKLQNTVKAAETDWEITKKNAASASVHKDFSITSVSRTWFLIFVFEPQ